MAVPHRRRKVKEKILPEMFPPFFFSLEAIPKVSSAALKIPLESPSGAFSVETLRVSTLKLPGMIFSKIFFKSVRHNFWNYLS